MTCFKLLVEDKPSWLGPRLMQRIIDRATQAKREAQAEQERTYQKFFKNLRNDKVKRELPIVVRANNRFSIEFVIAGHQVLVVCRLSIFIIFHVWQHISKFVELLFKSNATGTDGHRSQR